MTELELMKAHCDACYVQDASGDLVCINDWLRGPAPLLWMGLTPQGALWRFRSDVPIGTRARAAQLIAQESCRSGDDRAPIHDVRYRQLFAADHAVGGPTFWLPKPATPIDMPTTRVFERDADLLRGGGLDAWTPDLPFQQPTIASLDDGRAVSICASVRITSVAHEAGVETLESHRRRGHGAAAVSAWTRQVVQEGALPLYSAAWNNDASRALAARVGFTMFGWG